MVCLPTVVERNPLSLAITTRLCHCRDCDWVEPRGAVQCAYPLNPVCDCEQVRGPVPANARSPTRKTQPNDGPCLPRFGDFFGS